MQSIRNIFLWPLQILNMQALQKFRDMTGEQRINFEITTKRIFYIILLVVLISFSVVSSSMLSKSDFKVILFASKYGEIVNNNIGLFCILIVSAYGRQYKGVFSKIISLTLLESGSSE